MPIVRTRAILAGARVTRPIFYDPSGTRRRWTARGLGLVITAVVLAAAVFAFTVVKVPPRGSLPLLFERAQPAPLRGQISAIGRRLRRSAAWLPAGTPAHAGAPLTVGFYVPWDDGGSAGSLAAHIGQLDWLVPSTIAVTGPAHQPRLVPDPKLARILAGASHHPQVLPMVQNAWAGDWDSAGATALLTSRTARARLATALAAGVRQRHDAGLVFDFEDLPASALPGYRQLLRDTRAALGKGGGIICVTLPVDDSDW